MSTTYEIKVNGETVDSRSKRSKAVELAKATHAENTTATVEVVTNTGTVVETFAGKSKGARPWTRTETHDGIEVDVPEGYTVAYTRSRVGAVVARADDKSGWLVITADGSTEAENTKVARQITNDLAAAYRESQAEAKAKEAEAKAERKAAKDAERKAAKEAKDAEKAAKAKAKADAAEAAEADESETETVDA